LNPDTIDAEYSKLEQEVESTGQAIDALAQKLQAAASSGDPNAREWLLDLKSVALSVQADHLQMQSLMQAVHDFTVSHLSDPAAGAGYGAGQPAYPPTYAPQPSYQMQQPSGGGMPGGLLGRFMGGGFGRAIATGAGFGLGDDLINRIL
jgi:hypothetical protein